MTYEELKNRTEARLERLRSRHSVELRCRKGCSSCCTDVTVLPVEWHAIASRIGKEGLAARNQDPERCPFLAIERNGNSGVCSIYPVRPLICRVHGLPLSYLLEEYDIRGMLINREPSARHVLWCDLNFSQRDRFEPGFVDDEVVDMVALQREIEKLNDEFLQTQTGHRWKKGDRLSLRNQLAKDSNQ